MRHVIVQENVRLKDQLRELKDESALLRERLGSQACVLSMDDTAADPTSERPAVAADLCKASASVLEVPWRRRRRVVEWCIRNLDGPRASEAAQWDHSKFELAEYEGVSFRFRFGARRHIADSESRNDNSSNNSCGLSLSIRGPGASRYSVKVTLEVEESRTDERQGASLTGDSADGGSSSSDGEPSFELDSQRGGANAASLGRSAPVLLQGSGRATCPCRWPSSSNSTIICRAQVEFVGFCLERDLDEPLRLVTACKSAVSS